MKKLFIALLFFSLNLFAQSPEQLMNEANKLYQQQNYEQAIEIYNKVLSQGYESSVLYYNLGNAYFKEGKLGYAILNYEKGLKLNPDDEDLIYNLKIANARTVDKITEVPKLFFITWWESLITIFSVSGWSIIFIIIFWIFLASIAVYFFSRKISLQRIAFLSGAVSLAVVVILAVILFARVNRETNVNHGILIEQSYNAKVSPDEKSNDAFVIHEGIKFSLEDQVGNWVKIRLIDGKVGWIEKNSFGKI